MRTADCVQHPRRLGCGTTQICLAYTAKYDNYNAKDVHHVCSEAPNHLRSSILLIRHLVWRQMKAQRAERFRFLQVRTEKPPKKKPFQRHCVKKSRNSENRFCEKNATSIVAGVREQHAHAPARPAAHSHFPEPC